MLTPNDITEKKFDKVIMGGYDMGAVDDFLDQLEKDYGALFKENTVLKNKMKLLVKKIEEYRSMDESMRKALNSAQTMAAQIIDKAKAEAQAIKDSAQKSGEEILAGYETRIHAQEQKLSEAKASVEEFVTRMTTMYSQGAEMLQTVVGKFATDEDLKFPEMKPIAPVQFEQQTTHFEPVSKIASQDELETESLIREFSSKPASQSDSAAAQTAASASQPVAPSSPPTMAGRSNKPKLVLPDTDQLPNLPPVTGNTKPQGNYTSGKIYPNSVVRHTSTQNDFDDEGETILLTPKPKFEFDDLQFGENYDNIKKSKK